MAHSHDDHEKHDHAHHDHDHHGHDHHAHDAAPEPEFAITLSPAHRDELARVAITWAQIEFLVANLVGALEKADMRKTSEQLEAMPIAARVDHLRGLLPRVTDEALRHEAGDVCRDVAALVPRRNQVLQGLWGDFIDYEGQCARPAAFHGPSGGKPFFATELRDLADGSAGLTKRLAAVLGVIAPNFGSISPRRFFFSDRAPPPGALPDWHP